MIKTKKQSIKRKNKPQKGFLYYFGNLLIIGSFLLAFIIFYPVIATYLFPPSIKDQSILYGDYITIPKIRAQAPIILNVDPMNQAVYEKELKKGVAHAKDTYLPGEAGTSFLFAHSSGNPLEQTNYNTVFLKLGDLEKGDEILIKRGDKIHRYNVTQTKIVKPSEVEYLKKNDTPGLIVQTCWPIGTAWRRLLVFAAPAE